MRLVLRSGRIWFLRYSRFLFFESAAIQDPRQKVAPYSFGHYSVSFARYDYPRIPQTSPRYALQRYNKRYDPGYDLDTLGYGGKSTIATIQKARPWL